MEQISDANIGNTVIYAPGTDVFLIGISALNQINANLFICTGTKNKGRILSISKVKEDRQMKYVLNDVQLVNNALLGLHAYTGCDTVSPFSGKSKVEPLKLMIKNEKNISTFASIGEEVEISTSSFNSLVEFVCKLYGHKENSTDHIRYKLYKSSHLAPIV